MLPVVWAADPGHGCVWLQRGVRSASNRDKEAVSMLYVLGEVASMGTLKLWYLFRMKELFSSPLHGM